MAEQQAGASELLSDVTSICLHIAEAVPEGPRPGYLRLRHAGPPAGHREDAGQHQVGEGKQADCSALVPEGDGEQVNFTVNFQKNLFIPEIQEMAVVTGQEREIHIATFTSVVVVAELLSLLLGPYDHISNNFLTFRTEQEHRNFHTNIIYRFIMSVH